MSLTTSLQTGQPPGSHKLFVTEMIWGRCKVSQETELHQQEVESKCTLLSLEYVCFRFFFFFYLYFHIKYILQEDEALEEAGGNRVLHLAVAPR